MPVTARSTQAHSNAGGQADAKPKLYNPRHPERTLLYKTVAEYFETWHELASAGQFDGQGDYHTPNPLCARRFVSIWNAASLRTALPGPGVTIVDTTTSSPIATRQAEPANVSEGAPGVVPLGHAISPTPESAPPKRSQAHYLWAVLIARIYEVFPLLCPLCGGQTRLIAFITEGTQIRKILDHIGVDPDPPQISPAREPPLWDDCSEAQTDVGVHIEPADWDLAAQPAPDYEVDQRINW